jgi:peroxiredoxin
MELQGETIAEALDRLCQLFGLRYHLADDGTIVLEPAPRPMRGLTQRTYWLKPDAFPAAPPALAILIARGIPFPPGTAAVWHPETQQLSVTNTSTNQAKVAALLESDFGGTTGSPTHWLLLTSGARIGFTVDKFEPDAISGRHPLYGRCHIPMAQVYSITSTSPEPASASDSLRDWRLVYAPEPVIPESGGEESAMLGKEAKTFRLPLLGGGDFDLAEQHGKIVILDFWATWCGPCVKSLPELTAALSALSAFPADRVVFVGVNQAEQAGHVKQFMEARSWSFTVAMDTDQNVARQYGVDGIPHTVIIGPDGKVAWVKTGYSSENEKEAAEAIKKLLAAPAPAPSQPLQN